MFFCWYKITAGYDLSYSHTCLGHYGELATEGVSRWSKGSLYRETREREYGLDGSRDVTSAR